MGGFRASDADRERYVDVIETAYVDGQLGDQDRELRVSRALTAETLDELDLLTRDLQNQPAPVVVRTPPPLVVGPTPAAPTKPVPYQTTPLKDPGLKYVGWGIAGVVALLTFLMAYPSPSPMEALRDESTTVTWENSVPAADYELGEAGVRKLVRRYEAKFGTREAYRVTLFSYRAVVHVPVAGARPRYEEWSWDGEWQRVGRARVIQGPTGTIDLRAVDVEALFENVEVATVELGVTDADVQRVELVGTAVGSGSVVIHVRNGRGDSATLETTPQGSRTRAVPHDG